MMNNQSWLEAQHIKQWKSLQEWVAQVKKGLWYIKDFRLDKESIGRGWRIVIYCERKDGE